jgi:hypothetical protein
VKLVDYNPWPNPPRLRGAKAQGIQYQNRVTRLLEEDCEQDRYGPDWVVLPGPWFSYLDDETLRHAQPDVMLVNFTQGRIVVVEVKLTYCKEAWWQLNSLYAPLVRAVFPEKLWDLGLLAIANTVPVVQTPTPGRYVRCWLRATESLGDLGILRLPQKTLPRLR